MPTVQTRTLAMLNSGNGQNSMSAMPPSSEAQAPSPVTNREIRIARPPSRIMRVDTLDDPRAGSGDQEASDGCQQMLRPSTALLLAAAVTELYPDAKYGIGPAIENPPGFYYVFDFGKPISDADLPAIE